MRSIMMAFANPDTAMKIRKTLLGAGLPAPQACPSGSALLSRALQDPSGGLVIVPSGLPDMSVPELLSRLPDTFDVLSLHSAASKAEYGPLPGLTILYAPFPGALLAETVSSLLESRVPSESAWYTRGRGAARATGGAGDVNGARGAAAARTPEESALLAEAKRRLMSERGMTEDQAHRHLQRRSMETGIRLSEIVRRVLEEDFY